MPGFLPHHHFLSDKAPEGINHNAIPEPVLTTSSLQAQEAVGWFGVPDIHNRNWDMQKYRIYTCGNKHNQIISSVIEFYIPEQLRCFHPLDFKTVANSGSDTKWWQIHEFMQISQFTLFSLALCRPVLQRAQLPCKNTDFPYTSLGLRSSWFNLNFFHCHDTSQCQEQSISISRIDSHPQTSISVISHCHLCFLALWCTQVSEETVQAQVKTWFYP